MQSRHSTFSPCSSVSQIAVGAPETAMLMMRSELEMNSAWSAGMPCRRVRAAALWASTALAPMTNAAATMPRMMAPRLWRRMALLPSSTSCRRRRGRWRTGRTRCSGARSTARRGRTVRISIWRSSAVSGDALVLGVQRVGRERPGVVPSAACTLIFWMSAELRASSGMPHIGGHLAGDGELPVGSPIASVAG